MKIKRAKIGTILVGVVAVVLLLAGFLKLINVGADDMVEGLQKANLGQHQTLISWVAILCGILLWIGPIRVFAVLMASAYWGGAMVAHLTYNDSVVMPAAFLVMLWIGFALQCDNESPFSD